METLFIPAKSKSEIDKSKLLELFKKLPKKLAIAYSSQYETQAREIKKILFTQHNITGFLQVLGCSKPELDAQAILLISDGKFHAVSLAHETGLPVYIYNRGKLEKILQKEIDKLKQGKKAAYMKFLNSKKIGILVSTKPGQQNLRKAIDIKKKLKDKNSFLFICNNIDINQFENFPEIQSWINTACPRLDMNDARIINAEKIKF